MFYLGRAWISPAFFQVLPEDDSAGNNVVPDNGMSGVLNNFSVFFGNCKNKLALGRIGNSPGPVILSPMIDRRPVPTCQQHGSVSVSNHKKYGGG
ncbi:MAG: hypothetical protein GWP11_06250 [Proteobacteria bacterium]|nr:hypothetical protein [Pseudomonadota bacterium]